MVWPIICGNAMACGQVCQCTGSLQLRVLRFCFLQDGDVGVGVFPEGEEVLVSGAGLGGVTGEGIGACEAEMGECAQREVQDDAAMVEELLELCGCGGAGVC